LSQNNSKKLFIIFLTVFLDLLGFGVIIPLSPFFAKQYGASPQLIGILASTYSAMQFIFAPLWGTLSTYVGRRPILLIGALGTSLSMLAFGLANSLFWLFLARLLGGIATANLSVAQAYIADITDEQNRAKGMGLFGAAFGLGFIFGPALGGILGATNHALPGLVTAGISLINFIFIYLYVEESLPEQIRQQVRKKPSHHQRKLIFSKQGLFHPALGRLLFIFFITTLAFSNLEGTFALFTHARLGFQTREVGYALSYAGILAVLIQGGLIGQLTRRFGEKKLLAVGLLLVGAGMALYFLVWSIKALLVCLTLGSIGLGLCNPSMTSLVSKSCAQEERGTIMGVQQSLGSLGRILGPISGGFLFEQPYLHHALPYCFGALLFLGAWVLSFGATTRIQQQK